MAATMASHRSVHWKRPQKKEQALRAGTSLQWNLRLALSCNGCFRHDASRFDEMVGRLARHADDRQPVEATGDSTRLQLRYDFRGWLGAPMGVPFGRLIRGYPAQEAWAPRCRAESA